MKGRVRLLQQMLQLGGGDENKMDGTDVQMQDTEAADGPQEAVPVVIMQRSSILAEDADCCMEGYEVVYSHFVFAYGETQVENAVLICQRPQPRPSPSPRHLCIPVQRDALWPPGNVVMRA
jgi:hypothetical protein